MSPENVAIVRAMYESTNARDWPAVVAVMADDIELHLHGADLPILGGEQAVGKPAVMEWFTDWFGMFAPDYRFDLEEVRDWGERVFLVGTQSGKGRSSEAPMKHRVAVIHALRDRKVAGLDLYADPQAALAAGP
jgi:ketosteroid isomerase-like protein